ncbi:DUF6048 family protein [Flavobacterium sp. N3904]|uniref:DUF6048 family protein n=1 Tax=Flavobacterium sp. N3904 TaxID=2986835 RepID=UPI0022244014|nr:DUF6048 family protein [Flavobacterium sp. N3904]
MIQSLKYFFSICFLLSLFFAKAQEPNTTNSIKKTEVTKATPPNKSEKKLEAVTKDTIKPKTDRYGIIVGVDLNKVVRSLYDSDYKGIGFVADYRLTKKIYLYGEIGNENVTTNDTQLSSTAKGAYTKLGFDYNVYNNWLDMENLITLGLRYGFSTFSQQLNSYDIYNPNPYFGQVPPIESGKVYNGLTSSWAEVAAGVNVKVFNNIYVGFSLQLKILVTNKQPTNFENLYIPGFNRTYDGNFGAGFNYTVSYFIPIYKKKVTPVKTTPKK